MRIVKLMALIGLVGSAPVAAADTPVVEVETLSVSPVVTQTVVLEASAEAVWNAFTTKAGYEGWAVPFARIDLAVGGQIEASYADNPQAGSPDNIVIEIQAYLPQELLVLKTVQAPPGTMDQDTLDRLVSIFEFQAIDAQTTRLTVHGVGYEESDEALKQFFIQGNAWSMQQLSAYLATVEDEPAP